MSDSTPFWTPKKELEYYETNDLLSDDSVLSFDAMRVPYLKEAMGIIEYLSFLKDLTAEMNMANSWILMQTINPESAIFDVTFIYEKNSNIQNVRILKLYALGDKPLLKSFMRKNTSEYQNAISKLASNSLQHDFLSLLFDGSMVYITSYNGHHVSRVSIYEPSLKHEKGSFFSDKTDNHLEVSALVEEIRLFEIAR